MWPSTTVIVLSSFRLPISQMASPLSKTYLKTEKDPLFLFHAIALWRQLLQYVVSGLIVVIIVAEGFNFHFLLVIDPVGISLFHGSADCINSSIVIRFCGKSKIRIKNGFHRKPMRTKRTIFDWWNFTLDDKFNTERRPIVILRWEVCFYEEIGLQTELTEVEICQWDGRQAWLFRRHHEKCFLDLLRSGCR